MLGARSLVPDLLNASSPFGLSLWKPGCVPPQTVRAELVEAGARWFEKHAGFEGGGRESPGVRVTFFCVAKRKSPKKRRPPVCDPFAALRGKLRRGRCGVRRRTHCAPLALRSNNSGESEHEAWALRRPCSPRNRPAAGAASRGGTAEQPNIRTATRAFAALGPVCAARGACARELGPSAAQRSNGPRGCFLPQPLCMRRGAQWAGWHVCRRTHMHRGLARRSCLNVAPKARSEFCDAPRPRAPQVAPARSAGDADSGVAFSLVTFFWRSKRKPLRRRAHTPASALNPSTLPKPARDPKLQQAQPEQATITIKNIAATAC